MMRGTYQVEFNQKEREREKEEVLETSLKMRGMINCLENELAEVKRTADLNEYKLKYFLYRVDQACKEIERTEYKSGSSAYRHLQKALWICGYVVNKNEIPTYEEMREVETNLLDKVKWGIKDEKDREKVELYNGLLMKMENNFNTLRSTADKLTEEAMSHLHILRINGKDDVAEALASFYTLSGTEIQLLREELKNVLLLLHKENMQGTDVIKMPEGAK